MTFAIDHIGSRPMTRKRVLIFASDPAGIQAVVTGSSLEDVHFSFVSDWEKASAALAKENFSAIVAGTVGKDLDAGESARHFLSLAPRTPLVMILPRSGGGGVREALRAGASEVLFEDEIGRELVRLLSRYLFSGQGLLRKSSLDELFDYCFPVITTTDMDLLSATIVEMFREALGASFGVLFREQDAGAGGGFHVLAASGFSDESLAGVFLLRFGRMIAQDAGPNPSLVGTGAVKSLHADDKALLGDAVHMAAVRYDVTAGTPIFGVIGMRAVPGDGVLEGDLVTFFCRQARLSLINAERSVQTQTLIYIDDLTKLYNSRYLNVVLDRELKRSERYRNFFSVLFMDLDFFKRVNDNFGHLVGTRVLVEAGQVLRACVRETDTVVRYGGDEFVVLLVETSAPEALIVAERMRKMIEAKIFAQELGLGIRLTISIGIAAFPEHATTKQHLLNLADQAMYRGKDTTRNVVYLATSSTVP